MDFKEKLLDSHLAFEQDVDLLHPIHDYRKKALKRFESDGFPSKSDELWKYTSLASIIQKDYHLSPTSESNIELKDVKKYFLNDIDSFKLVFVDGIFSPFLSKTTHDGMDICVLSAAISKSKYKKTIKKYFNKVVPENESLSSLNTSYTKEGAYIFIPKNMEPEDPIQILHFSTGAQKSIWLQPRNLIVMEANSSVQIIERHQSLTDHKVVTNSVTEIYADSNSHVDYYKIQNDLFIVGSDLANPDMSNMKIRTTDEMVKFLEQTIDIFETELDVLNSFILPGGTLAGSILHLSRTIARRAETNVVALSQNEQISKAASIYLNRLSDLLFVLARMSNKIKDVSDVVWKP